MAEYIFTPSNIEHPTKEELRMLLRLYGHDYKSDLHTLINDFDKVALENNPQKKEGTIRRFHTAFEHIAAVNRAIEELSWESKFLESVSISNVLNSLSKYCSLRGVEVMSVLPKEINLSTSRNVVYLQLFHFLQNGVRNYEHNRINGQNIHLGAELVHLTSEELVYLGKNAPLYSASAFSDNPNSFVRTFVSDRGSGIPEEELSKLFQPREKDSERGIGLGLADCVCDKIHGFIKVESEVGEGSTFSLYYPQERRE